MNIDSLSDYELLLVNNLIVSKNLDWIKFDRTHSFTKLDSLVESFSYTKINLPRTKSLKYYTSESVWHLCEGLDYDTKTKIIDKIAFTIAKGYGDILSSYSGFLDNNITHGDYRIDQLAYSKTKNRLQDIAEHFYNLDPDKFTGLFNQLNISKLALQKQKTLIENRKRSRGTRSNQFNKLEQRYIAEKLFQKILDQNYMFSLINNDIPGSELDRSGKSLFDSLKIFNIDPTDLLDNFTTHEGSISFDKKNAAALRRFVLQYSTKDYSNLGLIDNDELIRLAAENKNRSGEET